MSEISTLISSLGFPIATAIILMLIVRYMFEKYTNDIAELNKYHKEEVDKFTEALNKNTLVLQQLTDKLDEADNVKIERSSK